MCHTVQRVPRSPSMVLVAEGSGGGVSGASGSGESGGQHNSSTTYKFRTNRERIEQTVNSKTKRKYNQNSSTSKTKRRATEIRSSSFTDEGTMHSVPL